MADREMSVARHLAALLLLLTSCGGGGDTAPPRSPSNDYPPPPAESNGEVVGADRQPPGDKLATSPRIGTEGVVPAAQPAHGEVKHGSRPAGSAQPAQ